MENDAKSILILILPFALLVTVVIAAWPLIVLAIALAIAWKLWQEYQWQQLSMAINPDFRRLVEIHQGKVTVADLALKTGLSGSSARWFLSRKAKEYGAQAVSYQNRGIVYYFLTAGALGNMFDMSDPDFDLDEDFIETDQPSASPSDIAQLLDIEDETDADLPTSFANVSALTNMEDVEASTDTNQKLIQADLAKRLDVHPSTLRKRRREQDFAQWSQSRDPDGIAWQYDPEDRQFFPTP